MLLTALGERPAATIVNLDKAERLGLIDSADEWLAMRKLRNQMVHEYVEDIALLVSPMQTGQGIELALVVAANRMMAEIQRRGWDTAP